MVAWNNDVYILNPSATSLNLFDALCDCLSKAEALASLTVTDMFSEHLNNVIKNYLWTLSHLIQEAQILNEAMAKFYFPQE